MIYLYTGPKEVTKKEVALLRKMNPEHRRLYFSKENFSEDVFAGNFLKDSLFDENFFVEIEDLLVDNYSFFEKEKKSFSEKSIFVFLETERGDFFGDDEKIEKKKFPAKGGEMDFSFWKAVSSRDKKVAWLSFLKETKNNPPELIHASLFSQVKNMCKAKKHQGEGFREMDFAKESSFFAAKKSAENYTEQELESFLYSLVKIKEESRGEQGPSLETLLEKTILEHV